MRKLATIRRIGSLTQIEGKDRIELATIDGWTVIVQRGEFNVGDLCIYCEPDSVLPDIPAYEFLRKRCWNAAYNGHRIKTMKMAGVYSYGIVFRFDMIDTSGIIAEGDDVTDKMSIRKFDPEADAEFALTETERKKQNRFVRFMFKYAWFRKVWTKLFVKPKQAWPSFIVKTDEERVQNCTVLINKMAGESCYIGEKLDGASMSTAWHNGKLVVCSRNIWLKTPTSSNYWTIARKYNLEKVLRKNKDIYIQGEICGPGIQKNKYGFTELRFFVFNIKEKKTNVKYTVIEMMDFCNENGLEHVPVLDIDYKLEPDVQTILDKSKGTSELANIQREGAVIRSNNPGFGSFSFKAINPEFMIKSEKEE